MSARTRPSSTALAAALLLLGTALSVHAQETVTLRGRVIDADTRRPIHGAIVLPLASTRGYVTDTLGRFTLEVPASGAYPLTAEQLGYAMADVVLASTAPIEFTTILLKPNPIALEGLSVLVDRFERRRRFYYGPIRVMDQAQLLRRPASSAYDVVRSNLPMARPCVDDMNELCTFRRGRREPVDICVDEVRAYGGAMELGLYGAGDLYMVEVYDMGREVRVYTRWFVENRLRSGRSLQPLSWGC